MYTVASLNAKRGTTLWHEFTPWLVLVCGLVATAAVTAFVSWTAHKQASTRFQFAVQDAEMAIQGRIEVYRALLRGGAGIVGANEGITREQFHKFVERLRLRTNYPGIQGFGYSMHVRAHEKSAVINKAREEGLTNFTIHPDRPGADAHAILYIEPLDARNSVALGYDMSSEPNRRAAMEASRDSGTAMSSGKVTLVQEIDPSKQAGFLIYSPAYRDGIVPATVEERREKLLGFVYAPFRADDLFAGIFNHAPQIEFDAYDGEQPVESALMHRSSTLAHAPNARRVVRTAKIVGREWTFVYYSTRDFERTPLKFLAPVTAGSGLLVSGVLFFATQAQRRAHRKFREQQLLETQRSALRAEIGTAFTGRHGDTRQLLQRCTDAVVRYLPAAFARIWLLDAREHVLVLQASSGMYTHIDGSHSRVPVGELKIGLIAAEKMPHLTNDVARDPRVGNQEWAAREKMVAFAGYPLMVEDRVIGVIAMFAREKLPAEILESLAGVADVIAYGIERRHAEEALRTAQENLRRHAGNLEKTVTERTQSLRETIASLEKFSYTVAHDLRAPVRAIYSFASLLIEDHAAALDADGKDYARRIVAGARRMDGLIQDLLAYTRLAHDRPPLTRVKLEPIVSAVVEESRDRIGETNAHIHVSPLPEVIGNPTLLHQVTANLIHNALKFVAPGTSPRIEISATEHGDHVRVAVKDNGIGIEPIHHQKIFGVFERLHGGEQFPGTGIGLAIVAKALERMNGHAGVESAPGQGSTFWFELPRPG